MPKTNKLQASDHFLISFCLFTYNQEVFVKEAIDGALSQTYSPLEIIISDDCSSDRTFEIVQEVISKYTGPHNIILNRNDRNMGFASSVNKVLMELANGKWFVFAAGDDISLPNRVDKMWEAISNNPDARGVHCAAQRMDEKGKALNIVPPKKIDLQIIDKESMLGAVAAYHKETITLFGPLSVHVYNEDMVLSLRALLSGRIVSIEEVCVLWRRHSNNLSGKIHSTIKGQMEFYYCVYMKKRIFSSIQQLNDILGFKNEKLDRIQELQELQLRLISSIKFAWQLSNLSNYFFYNKPIPFHLKINPFVWGCFIKEIVKRYLVHIFRLKF